MARRRIGQETLGLPGVAQAGSGSVLDQLATLIDWAPVEARLKDIYAAAKGEPAWPPLALVTAWLSAVWHDLSHGRLAEARDDRASFRRFCGLAAHEPTPERTSFVRFRRALLERGLDAVLFDEVTGQLRARAVRVKTGTLVDAAVIASASKSDGEAGWAPEPQGSAQLQGACGCRRRHSDRRGGVGDAGQRERRPCRPERTA